jgi:hypothetical protein
MPGERRSGEHLGRRFVAAYNRGRAGIAYALVAFALAPQFLPLPAGVSYSALSVLGFVGVSVLFDVEARLQVAESANRFSQFYEVAAAMRSAALSRADRSGLHLQAVGMSMGHAWTFLAALLDEIAADPHVRDVKVDVAMLDPEWDQLEAINPHWAARCRPNRQAMETYSNTKMADQATRNWALQIHTYRHMPNWHGICLDGEILFLSTCSWRDGNLVGGENEYERFERGRGDRSARAFELFESWLGAIQVPRAVAGTAPTDAVGLSGSSNEVHSSDGARKRALRSARGGSTGGAPG